MEAFFEKSGAPNFLLTKINEKLISFFATPHPLPPLTGGGLHPPSYKNGGQNFSYGPFILVLKRDFSIT